MYNITNNHESIFYKIFDMFKFYYMFIIYFYIHNRPLEGFIDHSSRAFRDGNFILLIIY